MNSVASVLATLALVAGLATSNAAAQTPSTAQTSGAGSRYPLQISGNHRYLVDQTGAPFLMVGDSPQGVIGDLSEADADFFFANRQAAGFNTQWINLLCNNYTGCRADGVTFDGIAPFTTPGDLSTPNEAYFSRVDRILRLADQHGQVVLLDPIETGGWLGIAVSNGTARAYAYGKYLGQRYRDFPNIVWMSGNDFQSWSSERDDGVILAVAQGIKDAAPHQLQTVELNYTSSGSLDDPRWAPLINLDAAYTYFPTYDQVLKEYNRAAVPVFMVEANYEGEHNHADQGTPRILRRQEYWTLLSGAAGQLYGNRYTWQFADDWKANLDTRGSMQMKYTTQLFAPRQWWNLVPDQNHSVVVAGFGTYVSDGALDASDYLTAARTADGSLAIAYVPSPRTVTVDLATLAGPVYASWYDPANASLIGIAGSPLANVGTHHFAPPGANADGDGDWALVLETQAVQAPSTTAADVVLAAPPPTPAAPPPVSANPASPVVAAPAVGAPSRFVQVNNAVPQSPELSVSVPYPQPQTAGDTNILAIGWNDASSTIVSVADSAGNTYQVAAPMARGDGVSQAIYYAPAIAGGANSVTVVFSGPVPFADIRIAEYAGLDSANPFDASASASGSDGVASSGAVTTSADGALIVGAGITTGAFTAAGSQFIARAITIPDADILEDATAPSSGQYAATAPGHGNWVMQVAAFR